MLLRRRVRAGSALVESALVYPVLFVVVLGIVLLGVGVFRYQQVSHAAREGSRWASVHGAKYAQETGRPAAAAADVYREAILPQAPGMAGGLTYSVTWDRSNAQTHTVLVTDGGGQKQVATRTNFVSVTVTYTWNTGLFGTIPVTATSVSPMSY